MISYLRQMFGRRNEATCRNPRLFHTVAYSSGFDFRFSNLLQRIIRPTVGHLCRNGLSNRSKELGPKLRLIVRLKM